MTNQDWQDPCLRLSEEASNAFTHDPAPKHTFIESGFLMYRLRTKISTLEQHKNPRNRPVGSNILKSPWWFTEQTYNKLIEGDDEITSKARKLLAVPERFNKDFDNLVIIKTRMSGYCFKGLTSPMPIEKDGNEFLQGGHEQLWIPNLQPNQIDIIGYGDVGWF